MMEDLDRDASGSAPAEPEVPRRAPEEATYMAFSFETEDLGELNTVNEPLAEGDYSQASTAPLSDSAPTDDSSAAPP